MADTVLQAARLQVQQAGFLRLTGRQEDATIRTGANVSQQARSYTASAIRDRYGQGNAVSTYGPNTVLNELGENTGNGIGQRQIAVAARLYRAARPQVLRQGRLFSDDTSVTASIGVLQETLTAELLAGATETGDNGTANNVQQTARLYRLTNQGAARQVDLLPPSSPYNADGTVSTVTANTAALVETAVSLRTSNSQTSQQTISNTADVYRSTGYRLFQVPQLLRNLFA